MITSVLLTYVIDNRGKDSVERTEIMKDNLVDLYDAIELDSMRVYIKYIRYYLNTEIGSEDTLKIELDKRNLSDIEVFGKARWIADQIGNIKKFSIERTDATNMFIGLKIDMRMTDESRKRIAPFILSDFQKDRFDADSIDLDDGTVFYIRERVHGEIKPLWGGEIKPLWRLEPEAASAFARELETVFDYHEDPTYVVMNRIDQPVYKQASL